jgi:hypothetical protein
VPWGGTLGKEIFKKNIFFAECLGGEHSAKNFSKKKFLCRVPCRGALDKVLKKIKKILCRVPSRGALGKASINVLCSIIVTFLSRVCRVPDKKHSAKRSLPMKFLSCTLYRVRHSAKPLPRSKWPLPSMHFQ